MWEEVCTTFQVCVPRLGLHSVELGGSRLHLCNTIPQGLRVSVRTTEHAYWMSRNALGWVWGVGVLVVLSGEVEPELGNQSRQEASDSAWSDVEKPRKRCALGHDSCPSNTHSPGLI